MAARYPGEEARCRFALLLERMGQQDRAQAVFREIIASLAEAGAVRKVESPDELVRIAVEFLQDEPQRARLAAAARDWGEANRGATKRTLAVIHTQLAALLLLGHFAVPFCLLLFQSIKRSTTAMGAIGAWTIDDKVPMRRPTAARPGSR